MRSLLLFVLVVDVGGDVGVVMPLLLFGLLFDVLLFVFVAVVCVCC